MDFQESRSASGAQLAFRNECISFFVHASQVLSIPRSVGEIYGLLYSSQVPLTMDDVIEELSMSKGSASQGLKTLRGIGAVRTSYVVGDRRDFFSAETELRKLAFGFLRESIKPQLNRGVDHLERLQGTVASISSSEARIFAEGRVKKLRRWHRFASQIVPLLLRVAAKF